MVANKKMYSKMYGSNVDCIRTVGGRCVGNCRKTDVNSDCIRTIGGRCVGNCRKTDVKPQSSW
ncbi:hypothetical protein ACJDU8_02485 [Clostridium sp. WILCCON 0269]|uniref:Uncharacterized protein n=1 Tax=Candidatus Clostridium eludens TaxID=3381663 RepID=A0ABW8SEZ5_9CLOT